MTGRVSYTTFDHAPAAPVPVIASFDGRGNIRPLYVRIGPEALKIHSARLRSASSGVVVYDCRVIDGDYQKPVTLVYHLKERLWTIPGA